MALKSSTNKMLTAVKEMPPLFNIQVLVKVPMLLGNAESFLPPLPFQPHTFPSLLTSSSPTSNRKWDWEFQVPSYLPTDSRFVRIEERSGENNFRNFPWLLVSLRSISNGIHNHGNVFFNQVN